MNQDNHFLSLKKLSKKEKIAFICKNFDPFFPRTDQSFILELIQEIGISIEFDEKGSIANPYALSNQLLIMLDQEEV